MLPFEAVNLCGTLLSEEFGEGRVVEQTIDGIGSGVDVPEIDLDGVGKHFGDTRLLGDDHGDMRAHSLQWRNAERL